MSAVKTGPAVPAVVLALSFVSGILTGQHADGKNVPWLTGLIPVMGMMAFVNPTPLVFSGVGFAAGAAVGCVNVYLCGNEPRQDGRDLTLCGKVLKTSPGIHGNTDMLIRVTTRMSNQKERVRFPMSMGIQGKDPPLPGSRVRVRAKLMGTYKSRIFGKVVRGKPAGDELVVDLGSPSTVGEARRKLDRVLSDRDEAAAGLLAALSLGRRWEVDRSLHNTLRRTGTYHFMAISGVHIGSALAVSFVLFNVLMCGLAADRVGWKKSLPVVGGFVTLSIYLSLAGLSASAVRAGIFVVFYWTAMIAGRYPHPPAVLGWCVTLIVCMAPGRQPDMALFMSVCAVTGIFVTGTRPCLPAFRALHVTTGAILFTLPLSVWCAGGISVMAPVCNLLAGLMFGFVLIPLAVFIDLLACMDVFPWELLVVVWIRVATPLVTVLDWFSDLPPVFLVLSQTGCIVASAAAITALVVWEKGDFRFRTGIFLFLAVVAAAGGCEESRDRFLDRETVLHFPGAGQADAAVFRSGRQTILIDCAAEGRPGRMTALERLLITTGVSRINALFLTHAHPDHTGGLRDLAARWPIDELYIPVMEKDSGRWPGILESLPADTGIHALEEGDEIRIGSFDFKVLGPPVAGWKEEGENASSLQLSVKWDGNTALFTGDAPWEQVLLSLGKMRRLEMIKIPHHGSRTGFPPGGLASTLSRLSATRGLTAVFPSPPPSTHVLPSKEVVGWFERRGVRCLFTGQRGGLTFRTGKRGRVPEF